MEIYHSKIGDFWLEADGVRIPFKLIVKTRNSFHMQYSVLDRKVFKPIVQSNSRIDKLALKTNINLSKFMQNDIISDEFVYGYDLVDNDFKIMFGTAIYTSSWDSKAESEIGTFWEDGGNFKTHDLPSYVGVDDVKKCRFSFAFCKFESLDDLSVDFACDFSHPNIEMYEEYISDLAYNIVDNFSKKERSEVLGKKGDDLLENHSFVLWIHNKYGLHDSNFGHSDDILADVVKLVFELLEEK